MVSGSKYKWLMEMINGCKLYQNSGSGVWTMNATNKKKSLIYRTLCNWWFSKKACHYRIFLLHATILMTCTSYISFAASFFNYNIVIIGYLTWQDTIFYCNANYIYSTVRKERYCTGDKLQYEIPVQYDDQLEIKNSEKKNFPRWLSFKI